MRSRDVRGGLTTVNPFWDAREKNYERCRTCGHRRPASSANLVDGQTHSRGSVLAGLGWLVVGVMAVVIAVLTAVLAGMFLVISVWLTVAVPVVVLLLVVGVAGFARRG